MKKIFAILLAACLLLSVTGITVFAADQPDAEQGAEFTPVPAPEEDVVMGLGAIKVGSTTGIPEEIAFYDNFEDAWNAAMELAGSAEKMAENSYDRVVVTLYADWTATNGKFTDDAFYQPNGDGFKADTIFVPEAAKVTLEMNGYTINRGLTKEKNNGEVICISDDADVIINNGTITGGYSMFSAGGIYIKDDAKVTLNNVNIVNNYTTWDGGGITVSDGSILTMNGGSFVNNSLRIDDVRDDCYGGAVYVEDAVAKFMNVAFRDNNAPSSSLFGAAIYANNSRITAEGCTFEGNGTGNETLGIKDAQTVIHGEDSSLVFKTCTFTGNGGDYLFFMEESNLMMTGGNMTNNIAGALLHFDDSTAQIKSLTATNNASVLVELENDLEQVRMTECVFGDNAPANDTAEIKVATKDTLHLEDCTMGDTTFAHISYVKITYNGILQEAAAISVRLLRKDGTTTAPTYYKTHAVGWNIAMETALSGGDFDSIIVDLYTDWTAEGSAGEFCNSGVGFRMDAICIPENARVTLNGNGHIINRNLLELDNPEYGGEVIYISSGANVIINDVTIKGGYSNDGAGGIHINGATVTLNNVNVVNNSARGDDGAGIAVHNHGTLVMNGGSMSNNSQRHNGTALISGFPYGTLYVCDSIATLNKVTMDGNYTDWIESEGTAIYATDSTVTLKECVISNNGVRDTYSESIIAAFDSNLIITNTDFIGNAVTVKGDMDPARLFCLEDSTLTMEGGKITGNRANDLFYVEDTTMTLKNVTMTDNASVVFIIENRSEIVTLTGCTLGNNLPYYNDAEIQVDTKGTLVLQDCEMGDTTFENKAMVTGAGAGSIMGEGSLTMIVAILALVTAVVAMSLTVTYNKKKSAPVKENE